MVRHLIVKAILTAGKSVYQAYKNVSNAQPKSGPTNPYTEWLQKTMQSANMISTPMNEEEAYKIFNIEVEKDMEEKEILD